jgi:flagellar motor switch protein FliN/FliY
MSLQTSAVEFLSKEFCEAVGAVFEQTVGECYSLRESGIAKDTGERESLDYALEFSGKVSGIAFVQIDLHTAAALATRLMGGAVDESASYLPEHEDAVFEIMSQAAGVMATSLRTRFEAADISVERKREAPDASSVTIVLEPVTGADGVSIVLGASQALCESITASLSGTTQSFPSMPGAPASVAHESVSESQNLQLIMDVELNVTLRFGQRTLTLSEVADLTSGSVVELDRMVDEPVELLLGERVIARGEVVIVDGNYGLRITELARIDHSALLTA